MAASMLAVVLVSPVSGQQSNQEPRLEEIIVTAERREARLQDAPVAVTAFSRNEIDRQQLDEGDELGLRVPSLVSIQAIGQSTAVQYYMRGAGQNDALPTLEPGVAVYVDDVYMARLIGIDRAFYDNERVEVLRGPQGTLYGRNAVGGAIKVHAARPDFEGRDYHLELGYGRFETVDFEAMFNQPLSDDFAVRFAASGEFQGEGTHEAPNFDSNVNDIETWGLRFIARYAPSDALDAQLRFDYNSIGGDCCYGSALGDTIDFTGDGRPFSQGDYDDDDLYFYPGTNPARNDSEDYGVTLTVDYDLGELSLKSITAYRYVDQDVLLDFTGAGLMFETVIEHDQFSQEFQLLGDAFDDRARWLLGLYYMHDAADSFHGLGLPNIGLNLGEQTLDNTTDAYALFTNVNYTLTDNLSLIVGLRSSIEDREITTAGYAGNVGEVPPAFTNQTLIDNGIPLDRSFNNFSTKLGVEYRINDTVMTYFSRTEAFKSGGWNARVFANPTGFAALNEEEVTAWEFGIKSEWAGNARLNLAAFRQDYEDLVVNRVVELPSGVVTNIATNAAEAYVDGIEFEGTYYFSDSVSMFVNGSWQDSEIDSLPVNAGFIREGNELNLVPEWSGQTGLDVSVPLENLGGELTARVSFAYQDRWFAGNENNPLTWVEQVQQWDTFLRFQRNRGDGPAWYIEAYCKNCTEDNYYTARFAIPPNYLAFPSRPRTYGIRFGIRP